MRGVLIAIALLVAASVACGAIESHRARQQRQHPGSGDGDEPAATSTSEPTAGASATPLGSQGAASPRCADAGAVAQRIAEGLVVPGGVLVDAFAVPRTDMHADFIAAEVDGPGWESPGDVMVWSMDDTGGIYSVNASAKEFSTWPDGGQADPPLSMDMADAREAEFCAEQAGFG
jgi:hypothetical protein